MEQPRQTYLKEEEEKDRIASCHRSGSEVKTANQEGARDTTHRFSSPGIEASRNPQEQISHNYEAIELRVLQELGCLTAHRRVIERYVVKNGRTDEITEEVERFSELEYSNGNGLPTICNGLEIL